AHSGSPLRMSGGDDEAGESPSGSGRDKARLASSPAMVAVVLVAVLAGHLVVRDRELLHLATDLSGVGLAALAGTVAVGLLFLKQPGLGLFTLVGFVYLNLSQILVRYHQAPSVLQLMVLPLALAAWTDRYVVGAQKPALSHLTASLVLYNLVLLGSSALARDVALADERFLDNSKALLVYLLVATLASSVARVRTGATALLLGGALLASCGVFQVLSGDFRNELGGLARIKNAHIYGNLFEPRIAGSLGDPNFFAQSLLIVVPLALFVARGASSWRRKALGYGSAAVISSATVLTYSRGGALALGVVLILSFWNGKTRLRNAIVALALVVSALVLLPSDVTHRLSTLKQILPGSEEVFRPDSSFEKRKLLTAVAWRIFLDHPLLGVGAGNYTVHYEAYADEVGSAAREYDDPDDRSYPHNLYLEIGAETGLMGLGVFAWALGACLVSLRRARATFLGAGDASTAGLARAFEIALVGYLVSSLFLHGHFQRYLYLLFAFSTALHGLSVQRGGQGGQGDGLSGLQAEQGKTQTS
ncbi:MAG: O-antigen ligase family protein, partial [Acidobacteriota bacterium]